MATRAKFRCESVEDYGNDSKRIKLTAVGLSDAEKDPENPTFCKYTPNGSVELYINNPAASVQFVPQSYYYADFLKAEK